MKQPCFSTGLESLAKVSRQSGEVRNEFIPASPPPLAGQGSARLVLRSATPRDEAAEYYPGPGAGTNQKKQIRETLRREILLNRMLLLLVCVECVMCVAHDQPGEPNIPPLAKNSRARQHNLKHRPSRWPKPSSNDGRDGDHTFPELSNSPAFSSGSLR